SVVASERQGILPSTHLAREGRMTVTIGRRELLVALGGAAAAGPFAARAQSGERGRRIGALMYLAADDPESTGRVTAFARGLQELGWIEGRNIQIEYRWGGGDMDRVRRYAAELVALAPDVILVSSGSVLAALQYASGIEQTIAGFSRGSNCGLIVTASPSACSLPCRGELSFR